MSERVRVDQLSSGQFVEIDNDIYIVQQLKQGAKYQFFSLACQHTTYARNVKQIALTEYVNRLSDDEVKPHKDHPNWKLPLPKPDPRWTRE